MQNFAPLPTGQDVIIESTKSSPVKDSQKIEFLPGAAYANYVSPIKEKSPTQQKT